jgi:hypothetical protein
MATVYITNELKSRTSSIIDKMRRQEIANDLHGYDAPKSVAATYLYHLGCWGKQHVHLVDVIPKEWLRTDKDVQITVTGMLDDGTELKFNQSFSGGAPMFYGRPSTDYWSRSESRLSIDEVRAMPEGTLGRAEILQRWDDEIVVRGINVRWEKISSDVRDFLDKCKSLNEAVKLFPTIRMYITPEDLERLDRKVERATQRRKLVEEVDTEGLTAAAIAAKLMSAT